MVIPILAASLSVVSFLFVFWRQLKDDYVSNQIFTTGFTTIIVTALLAYFSYLGKFQGWFWVSIVGIAISIVYNAHRFRMRIIEVAQASIIGSIFVLLFVYGGIFASTMDYRYLFGVGLILVLIFIFYILNSSYKRFSWYKSGRVGFAGFATLMIAFVLRTLVAIRFPDMISFTGSIDVYLSLVLALGSFGILIYLSRKI